MKCIPLALKPSRLTLSGLIPTLVSIGILVSITACGGSNEPTPQATVPQATVPQTRRSPVYDLHEWGVVNATRGGFEVAAGPGRQEGVLLVDKPVLYVHSNSSFDLTLTVNPVGNFRVAEHFPNVSSMPLRWNVAVQPETCRGTYPSTCSTPDGYCESVELSLYETEDAACLTFEDQRLPLLFYRMLTDEPPVLPLHAFRDETGIALQNHAQPRTTDPYSHFWRVTWNPQTNSTHASRFPMPISAETVYAEEATGDVTEAQSGLRSDMIAQGLTTHEGEAFMRGWEAALFGESSIVEQDGTALNNTVTDSEDANSPEDTPIEDSLVEDESRDPNRPVVQDAILYWLSPAAIETLATVDATPPPRSFSRAMLVRVDLR